MKNFDKFFNEANANKIVDVINANQNLKDMINDFIKENHLTDREAQIFKTRIVLQTLVNVGEEM